jgi:site-specific DNA-methyltransferase (adenine-specific)
MEVSIQLAHGDCLHKLRLLAADSIDALVTDPPAGISFMGKDWDGDKGGRLGWVNWMSEVMAECLRVMKPGAHGLVWALPRTSHWTACALEDAGFEIRDCVYHIFGSGFPKSLDVSKAIDKAAGAERWAGWGTALKPAVECWWLVRKPLSEKTVAANVLKWGTGALNIDASRVETKDALSSGRHLSGRTDPEQSFQYKGRSAFKQNVAGRYPAHVIFDEEAGAMLDEQSGFSKTPNSVSRNARVDTGKYGDFGAVTTQCAGDSGGASRFFYCAKTSQSERGEGNTHPTVKSQKLMRYLCRLVMPPGGTILDPFMGSGSTGLAAQAEGFNFCGIEKEAEYFAIAKNRLGLS